MDTSATKLKAGFGEGVCSVLLKLTAVSLQNKFRFKKPEMQEDEKNLEAKIPQVGSRVGVKEKNGTILYGVITKLLDNGRFSVLLDNKKRRRPTIDKIVRQGASSKKSPSGVPNLKF